MLLRPATSNYEPKTSTQNHSGSPPRDPGPETKELLYINRSRKGPFRHGNATLVHTTWSGSWQQSQRSPAPRGASWLFLSADNRLVTLTPTMVHGTDSVKTTVSADNGSQVFTTSSGEILVLSPDGEVTVQTPSENGAMPEREQDTVHTFVAISPQRGERFTDTFSSAMDFSSGNIIVFDESTLTLFSRQYNGTYAPQREQSLPDCEGPAALAITGSHILVADSDGQVSILDTENLQPKKTFEPTGTSR